MKTSAARKGENRDADLAAGGFDTPLHILEIGGIENDERSALGRNRRRGGEAARQAASENSQYCGP